MTPDRQPPIGARPADEAWIVFAMTSTWVGVKRVLTSLALGLALFICMRVSRAFIAEHIVGPLTPITALRGIAWIAIVAGIIPALPLGFGYGLMRHRHLLVGAVVVALLGGMLELATSSLVVPWWTFITWWLLPLDCLTVLVVFVIAAVVGSRSLQHFRPPVRSRLGVCLFVLLTVPAATWPWLDSCLRSNVCSLVPPP